MKDLTVLINTFNEEKNIRECINSVQFLQSKIIVVDMHSNDDTVKLAQRLGAQIYNFTHTSYVEPSRKFAIDKAETDWVLILDADERITKELADEILKSISAKASMGKQVQDNKYTHYKVPRKNIFATVRWLKHGGWWPDYQIRLINKQYFKTWPKEIHSTPAIEGKAGILKNPIVHYFHGDLESMVEKTIIFEDIESDLLLKADKNVNTLTFFRKFMGELYRRLIKNLGFLDGEIGIIESIYQAFSKTITYLFLYEKKKHSALRPLP